jgi:hypothetical protein
LFEGAGVAVVASLDKEREDAIAEQTSATINYEIAGQNAVYPSSDPPSEKRA